MNKKWDRKTKLQLFNTEGMVSLYIIMDVKTNKSDEEHNCINI